MKGTVKFFNDSKNFGFIQPEDGSKDLFVHKNDIIAGPIRDGDAVEFDAEDAERGRKAVNVKKI